MPDYGDAHYNLGLLLIGMGRQTDALAEFKATLKSDPNNAAAHDAHGARHLDYSAGRYGSPRPVRHGTLEAAR